ncbi:sensor histidine kinase [Paracraurococcus lichenis]|uniref:histidine kinase n=1 Tax=Paracraurococcus lichenis TaxID=3064888 RepID=A0ABT9DXB6_9PROT|nr:HWE histidine kinase domain-containing protein [Paracraurococcus sp. LOR1-02]MDO9708550.1 HWE histidine kinase domain-containing protein [Paracraurococcus sp. LOR1-02]
MSSPWRATGRLGVPSSGLAFGPAEAVGGPSRGAVLILVLLALSPFAVALLFGAMPVADLPEAVSAPHPALPWIGVGILALVGAGLLRRVRVREKALRQEKTALEERLRTVADLSHAFEVSAVILRDLDGTIRRWSAGCERLFGFTAAEALGQRAHELLGTRFPDGGRRGVQDALLAHGEWQGELRHRRRGGEAVIVASHWTLRQEAGVAGTVVEVHADATALKAAEAALRAGEARLRLAQEVAGIGTWEWDPEADSFVWSPEHSALFGTPGGTPPATLEGFLALVHPDDRAGVRAGAWRALESGEYEAEFRILRPGRDGSEDTRWLLGRGRRMPGPAGRLGPILGVHMDFTARKEAEERQALLMREVDHRAKNALAVVQAVLRLTKADSPQAFGRAIEGRVAALARAQTLLTESRWMGADLMAMLRGELDPFLGNAGSTRVTLDGPPLTVAPMAAQPLSMTLHELATNSAKYGSLSLPGGALDLSWSVDPVADRLRLRWAESGGPSVAGPPAGRGFGSRVIRTTIHDQLGGEVTLDWQPSGLVCLIELPLGRVVARADGGRRG